MAKTKKKAKASNGNKRVTVASVMQAILTSKKIPGTPVIISMVHKKTGNKSFDAKQKSWYFSQARKGKLSWQKGKKLKLAKAGAKKKK